MAVLTRCGKSAINEFELIDNKCLKYSQNRFSDEKTFTRGNIRKI